MKKVRGNSKGRRQQKEGIQGKYTTLRPWNLKKLKQIGRENINPSSGCEQNGP